MTQKAPADIAIPGVEPALLDLYAKDPLDLTLVLVMADRAEEAGESDAARFLRWAGEKRVHPYPSVGWRRCEDAYPFPDETIIGYGWNRDRTRHEWVGGNYRWPGSVLNEVLSDSYDRNVGRSAWYGHNPDAAPEMLRRLWVAWLNLGERAKTECERMTANPLPHTGEFRTP